MRRRARRQLRLEQGRLVEVYLERRHHPDLTANIYKGRVVKVVPGMDAAFVDIGLERPAYLFVDEVAEQWDSFCSFWLDGENQEAHKTSPGMPPPPIEDLLQDGQDLLVQISRPPLGGKGARITTHITLPVYYLVYAPTLTQLGVSRRIAHQAERERLLGVLQSLEPKEGGLIARTASLGQPEAALRRERDALVSLWQTVGGRWPARRGRFACRSRRWTNCSSCTVAPGSSRLRTTCSRASSWCARRGRSGA